MIKIIIFIMSTINQDFTNKLKTWVAYELKQQELKSQMNKISEAKEQLGKDVIQYIKMNNMQKTAINVGNNKIFYHDDSQYNNLTFNFLNDCLMLYFNNDVNKVSQICNFIKSKRSKTIKPSLKCVIKKII
jgi:hypothetical protein